MASYTILSEGTPIVPVNLQISFPVNHTVTYTDNVLSDKTGAELQAQFEAYVLDHESQIKQQLEFSTQDGNRNGTFQLTETMTGQGGFVYYDCEYTFTIENAVVTIDRQTQTDLTGTAKDDFLAAFANDAEVLYFSERPTWVAL